MNLAVLPNMVPAADEVVEIPVRGGHIALVDAIDAPALLGFRWLQHRSPRSYTYYALRFTGVAGYSPAVMMHREILGLTDRRITVDHRDGNGLNNRRSNLRIATGTQNNANRRRLKNNSSSQFKGVKLRRGVWDAGITAHRRCYFLGTFADEMEAAAAYDRAAVELFGEFARLNLDPEVAARYACKRNRRLNTEAVKVLRFMYRRRPKPLLAALFGVSVRTVERAQERMGSL